jgi:hypothetical protein
VVRQSDKAKLQPMTTSEEAILTFLTTHATSASRVAVSIIFPLPQITASCFLRQRPDTLVLC